MADAMDVFKQFYSELTKVLPMIINDLVTKLYSDKLLSGNHKDRIDSLPTDKEKTEYFLDKVIKPGLDIKYTKIFDEMLKVMKTGDDPTVNYLVDEIQKCYSATTTIPLVDEKQSTPKGNHYNAAHTVILYEVTRERVLVCNFVFVLLKNR